MDAGLGADEVKLASPRSQPLEGSHKHPEAGGIKEVDAVEVDHDVGLVHLHQLVQLLPEARRRGDIDLAGNRE